MNRLKIKRLIPLFCNFNPSAYWIVIPCSPSNNLEYRPLEVIHRRWLGLHRIGEPLINRDLPRVIAHLKERDVTVLFNTNTTLLTEERRRKLIDSGLDEMRYPIDGTKTETYARIRRAPVLATCSIRSSFSKSRQEFRQPIDLPRSPACL